MKRRSLIQIVAILTALTIVGSTPILTAKAAPGPAYDLKFAGVITAVPEEAGAPWVIGGQNITTNVATRIKLTTDTVAPGMWADVTAMKQIEDSWLALQIVVMPPEMRLKGPVEAMPPSNVGAWTVAGQVVQVVETTRISERGGALALGVWAEVNAVEDPAGTLTATRIRSIEPQADIAVYGAIQACVETTCTLSAVPFNLDADTLIRVPPQPDLLAHAAATLQNDGTLLASLLRVEWQEPEGAAPAVQLTGAVQSLPQQGLNGNWVVEGHDVVINAATLVNQAKGLVEVGARVQVFGWSNGDKLIATQVTVLESASTGPNFFLAGPVEAMPSTGVVGVWTIAGQQVQVTTQTRLQEAAQIRLGQPVEVSGLQLQTGVRVATWLRTRTQSGPGPQPSATPRGTGTPGGPQPSHTPQPGGTPQGTGTPGGPQPSHTPQPTHTPGGGPGPARTPDKS
jgi:hypothetical protein